MKHIVVSEDLPQAKLLAQWIPEVDAADALATCRMIAASGTRAAPFFTPLATARWLSRGWSASAIAKANEAEQFRFLGWYCFSQPKNLMRWADIQDIEAILGALTNSVIGPTSVKELPLTALMLVACFASEDQPINLDGVRTCDPLITWYADELLRWFCLQGVLQLGLTSRLTKEQKARMRQPVQTGDDGVWTCLAAAWLRALRSDVSEAFALKTPESGQRLESWFLQYGLWEHDLTYLLTPDELGLIRQELTKPDVSNLPEFLKGVIKGVEQVTSSVTQRAAALHRRRGFWPELLGPQGAEAIVFPNRAKSGATPPRPATGRPEGYLSASRYRIANGQRVHFVTGSSAVSLLLSGGWNLPEHFHTWSSKPISSIGFALDPGAVALPAAASHIEIELEFHYEQASSQQFDTCMTLTLDGMVFEHIELQTVQTPEHYSTVKATLPYRPGVHVLGIGLDRVFSPSEFGSHDTRMLGVAVRSLLVRLT